MSNDLRGQFIANTFQNLVQKPDTDKEEYFNGVGSPIYLNGDPIGTVKMFYPIGGTFGTYFDPSTGLGRVGSSWFGWAVADGRNGTPDLRGRTTFGVTDTGNTSTVGNNNATASEFSIVGATGGSGQISIDNVPPHRHQFSFVYPQWGNNQTNWFSWHFNQTGGVSDISHPDGKANTGADGIDDDTNDLDSWVNYSNTSDGTVNLLNQDALKANPDNFYQPYVSLFYVIKIS